ncbi:MAG: uracil-DNA glycosylase [Chlamydiia bacterium]|nr:uracil-DNA glycosylase [Chlamydiia bacterium]
MIAPPPQLEKSWQDALVDEWEKPYMQQLVDFLTAERRSGIPIYPSSQEVFNAFHYTHFDQVKVVIVGQDPYHGPGQAHGLSFSVQKGLKLPPSLQNIFKEIESDLGMIAPESGCLINWAKQGVLLLNAVLTVREGAPRSHYGKGWEIFTDAVIAKLAAKEDAIIFILWGKSAQEKCCHFLENHQHFVLTAPHPSPFSVHTGFFGCSHFSKANNFLKSQGKVPIDWGAIE